jgi:hypothetical protein
LRCACSSCILYKESFVISESGKRTIKRRRAGGLWSLGKCHRARKAHADLTVGDVVEGDCTLLGYGMAVGMTWLLTVASVFSPTGARKWMTHRHRGMSSKRAAHCWDTVWQWA